MSPAGISLFNTAPVVLTLLDRKADESRIDQAGLIYWMTCCVGVATGFAAARICSNTALFAVAS